MPFGTKEQIFAVLHVLASLAGGILFTIGSAFLITPTYDGPKSSSSSSAPHWLTDFVSALIVGWCYTVGSIGFLTVDSLDLWWLSTQVTLPPAIEGADDDQINEDGDPFGNNHNRNVVVIGDDTCAASPSPSEPIFRVPKSESTGGGGGGGGGRNVNDDTSSEASFVGGSAPTNTRGIGALAAGAGATSNVVSYNPYVMEARRQQYKRDKTSAARAANKFDIIAAGASSSTAAAGGYQNKRTSTTTGGGGMSISGAEGEEDGVTTTAVGIPIPSNHSNLNASSTSVRTNNIAPDLESLLDDSGVARLIDTRTPAQRIRDERRAILLLRFNTILSIIGNITYLIGSVAFIPQVDDRYFGSALGNWGFIAGSVLIFVSQCWKIFRASTTYDESIDPSDEACQLAVNYPFMSQIVRVAIEVGACLGGISFFVGTVIYADTPKESIVSNDGLDVWVFGSLAFTFGGVCLSIRHFVFGLI